MVSGFGFQVSGFKFQVAAGKGKTLLCKTVSSF